MECLTIPKSFAHKRNLRVSKNHLKCLRESRKHKPILLENSSEARKRSQDGHQKICGVNSIETFSEAHEFVDVCPYIFTAFLVARLFSLVELLPISSPNGEIYLKPNQQRREWKCNKLRWFRRYHYGAATSCFRCRGDYADLLTSAVINEAVRTNDSVSTRFQFLQVTIGSTSAGSRNQEQLLLSGT